MGKIRVKAVGDEELEKEQLEKSKARSVAKKTEKAATNTDRQPVIASEAKQSDEIATSLSAPRNDNEETTPKKAKKEKFQKAGKIRSESYKTNVALITAQQYKLKDAVTLIPQFKKASFDETVELHFTTSETGMSGSVTLPHGTGKTTRVAIADGANQDELEKLIKEIESGNINFDILVATPDAMPKLAKVARTLGPRGLMPNPKTGTVTTKPDEVAKKYEGGQINFKTEAKFPLIHIAVGKVSFGDDKLTQNIKVVLDAIDKKKIKNATLKSTMSPAIHLDITSL